VRNAAHEVGRAIQRVDDPQVIGAVTAAFEQSTFLAKDAVIRIGLAQRCNDALLGRLVDLGDVILCFFLVDRDCIQAIGGTDNQFAGAAGGAARYSAWAAWINYLVVKESAKFYQESSGACSVTGFAAGFGRWRTASGFL